MPNDDPASFVSYSNQFAATWSSTCVCVEIQIATTKEIRSPLRNRRYTRGEMKLKSQSVTGPRLTGRDLRPRARRPAAASNVADIVPCTAHHACWRPRHVLMKLVLMAAATPPRSRL